ncbi:MAG: DUF4199 domain-containing protein [Micropepsaceae bacterium]
MLRIALTFGIIAGAIIIAGIIATFSFSNGHGADGMGSVYLGYLIMILGLSMVFFGVKRYRDRDLGGVIKFLPALLLGLGIATVASLAYVAIWEGYLAVTHYAFADVYASAIIEAKKAAGVTGPALDAVIAEMNEFKVQYADPLFRMPMTFIEIFPVGVLVALISAAILRNSKVLPDRA